MRVPNKKSPKKIIITSSVVVALLVTSGLVYAFREDIGLVNGREDTANYDRPTDEQLEGEATAEQTQDDADADANTANEADLQDNADSRDGTAESAANEVIISSVNQDGNTLAIRTIIQPLVDGGTCTLAMSKAGQSPVRQTASVQAMPSYSTCQGFNIDVSDLAKGSWNLEITYSNNGQSVSGKGTAVVR